MRSSSHDDLPVLVVPALYLASDDMVANLLAYAEAGGHLVLGIRTAYADEIGRPKLDRQPAGLSEAAGVWYDEFSNLVAPLKVSGQLAGHAERLAEGLIADGAEIIAEYDHPHFGRWPAATTQAIRQGPHHLCRQLPRPRSRAVARRAGSPRTTPGPKRSSPAR